MSRLLLLVSLWLCLLAPPVQSQPRGTVSTMDFVAVLNDNHDEALYYYQNNWALIRERAMNHGYIESFQLLQTPFDQEAPFHLVLITSYPSLEHYENREANFQRVMGKLQGPDFLNDKRPADFRQVVFSKEAVRHLSPAN
jgi:hypothetical protein